MNNNLDIMQKYINEHSFKLVELKSVSHDDRLSRVELWFNNRLVDSFGSSYLTENQDINEEAYKYILGFLDAYQLIKKTL